MTPDTRPSEERLEAAIERVWDLATHLNGPITPAFTELRECIAALQQREKALREIVECVAQDDFRFNGCRCTSDLPGECYLHSVLIPKALGAPGEEG